MVKAFIKPITEKRNFKSFLYRYLVEPPLIYWSDADPEPTKQRPVQSFEAVAQSDLSLSAVSKKRKHITEHELEISKRKQGTHPAVYLHSIDQWETKKHKVLNTSNQPSFAPMNFRDEPSHLYRERLFKINLFTLIKRAFIVTYGYDGLDHTSGEITFSKNDSENRQVDAFNQLKSFSTWILIASFLGFPTRARQTAFKNAPEIPIDPVADVSNSNHANSARNPTFIVTSLSNLDSSLIKDSPKVRPSLGFLQLLSNFIGGWEPIYEYTPEDIEAYRQNPNTHPLRKKPVWTEKKIWQVATLIPIKFPIIFAFKLISIPLKLAVNILKLFTEFLPQIITSLLAASFYNAIERMHKIATKRIHPISKGFQLAGLGVLTFILGILNYSSRLLTLILRAATSPELSARKAYAAGREYYINGRTLEESESFSKMFGFFAASISILITTTVWALTLPLVIGALMTYLPVYLPTVFQALTTVTQLPLVTKSIALLNTVVGPVGNFLMGYAGSVLSSLSTFLGVQIPSLALILGTAIGALLAPTSAIASRLADEFSNSWAKWYRPKSGPVTAIVAYFTRVITPKPYCPIPLLDEELSSDHNNLPMDNNQRIWFDQYQAAYPEKFIDRAVPEAVATDAPHVSAKQERQEGLNAQTNLSDFDAPFVFAASSFTTSDPAQTRHRPTLTPAELVQSNLNLSAAARVANGQTNATANRLHNLQVHNDGEARSAGRRHQDLLDSSSVDFEMRDLTSKKQ